MDRPRVAMYSHDAMGLGHMRRNTLIAGTLAAPPLRADVLLISGARELNDFDLPPGVDCITLPAFRKGLGGYLPRSLNVPSSDLASLRAELIWTALDEFDPDIFIVDKHPRGILNELDAAHRHLRARTRTRCVLGLRDILDDPSSVRVEWARAKNEQYIQEYFDAVWVYGDPAVYDAVDEYSFSLETAAKLKYSGYLNPDSRSTWTDETSFGRIDIGSPFALCMTGGGLDGGPLAEAFAKDILLSNLNGVIVGGPYLPPDCRRRLYRRAALSNRLRIIDFIKDPRPLVCRSECVVSMAGYNTICEILAVGKPLLVVPRTSPRSEQFLRASRFRDLGLLDMIHPEQMVLGSLDKWMRSPVARDATIRDRVDFGGLTRLPEFVNELMGLRRSA